MRSLLLRSLLVLLLASGCFAPQLPPCAFRCDDGMSCPPGTTCAGGFCRGPGDVCPGRDAGSADAGERDAPLEDVEDAGSTADAADRVDAEVPDADVILDAALPDAPPAPIFDAPVPDAPTFDAPVPDAPTFDAPVPDAPGEPDASCQSVCADQRRCGVVAGCNCGACGDGDWCTPLCAFAVCEAGSCCLPESAPCETGRGQCCGGLLCAVFCVAL
jgi:hypothetical protein